jgi:hypothetical protein
LNKVVYSEQQNCILNTSPDPVVEQEELAGREAPDKDGVCPVKAEMIEAVDTSGEHRSEGRLPYYPAVDFCNLHSTS